MTSAPAISLDMQAINKPVRRVVTGLDADGRSCVLIDDRVSVLLWSTGEGKTRSTGTQFICVEMQPGWDSPWHATDTIDYIVILEGEVVLCLETGEVILRAGDTLVQGGVLHAWRNDFGLPARTAGVLVDIDPVGAGARGLPS